MKKFGLFLSCLAFCFLWNGVIDAQTTVIQFVVELPVQGISQDSAVYIMGNFNGWNPKDENYRMVRIDDNHYRLDVPCFADKNYEYKYTLGGWEHVEKSADGKEIGNRQLFSKKKLKIKDVVIAWNVPAPKTGNQNSFASMLSKEQIDKMAQMKDSVTKNLAPVVPQLLGILKKINDNLLAEKPDFTLSKEYNAEATAVVAQVLGSLSETLMRLMSIFTPEQKQKLRDAMKNSTNPGDLINLITK